MKINNNTSLISNNVIVPARLREARIARGYSMAELAERIGVTKQSISCYELGNATPSASVLMKIIEVLEFPLLYFKKTLNNSSSAESTVFFRSLKTTAQKLKDASKIRLSWLEEIYHYLSQFVHFPEVDIPDISDYTSKDNLEIEDIENIATAVRKSWNLGSSPIENITEILQEKGFVISRIEFHNQKIDAFSQWRNGIPYIFLGSDKSSAARSRFDIAHELGHLLLHPHIEESELKNKLIWDKIEKEAHCFAAAFLLPAESFTRDVMSTSIDHFILLKRRWKVSVSAMIKRCEHLNLFTDGQISYLMKQMTLRKMWRKEPLDDVLEFETPYMLKQAVQLLLDNQILSVEELLDSIAYPKEDIENLCYLPEGTLSRKPKLSVIKLK
jgi:Zn-dependent peptidase ImmA (M78 family)/transcriptional regulator with XRE-family HTH domain